MSSAAAPGKMLGGGRRAQRQLDTPSRAHAVGPIAPPMATLHASAGHRAVRQLLGSGAPLPDDVRAEMESRFGVDFGDVRIHADGQAQHAVAALGARALTAGSHVAFASAQFAPRSLEGTHLLMHELAHVVQQRNGRDASPGTGAVARNERAAEHVADTCERLAPAATVLGDALAGGGGAPAVQFAPDERAQRAPTDTDRNAAAASALNILYAEPDAGSIDEMLHAAVSVQGYFVEATDPDTRATAAQRLLQIRGELKAREASAVRAPDGALLQEDWRGTTPWADSRPTQLEDLFPFGPGLVDAWQQSQTGDPAQSSAEAEAPQTATALAERSGLPGANVDPVDRAMPPVNTRLHKLEPDVTEEADPTSGPEIQRALAMLAAVTVSQVVAESAGFFHQQPAALAPEVAELPLQRAASRILFLSNRLYVLDASGHIAAGEPVHQLEWSSMEPGGVYFFAKYALDGSDEPVNPVTDPKNPLAGMYGDRPNSSTRVNLLMRIDGGTPRVQLKDFGVQSVNADMVPLLDSIGSILDSGAGLAIVVARDFGRSQTFSADFHPTQVISALAGAKDYVPWAVRSRLRMLRVDLAGEIANLLVSAALDHIARAFAELGQGMALSQALEAAAWLGDLVNIAAYAQGEDELRFVSQMVARAAVEQAYGEVTSRVIARGVNVAHRRSTGERAQSPGSGVHANEPGRNVNGVPRPHSPRADSNTAADEVSLPKAPRGPEAASLPDRGVAAPKPTHEVHDQSVPSRKPEAKPAAAREPLAKSDVVGAADAKKLNKGAPSPSPNTAVAPWTEAKDKSRSASKGKDGRGVEAKPTVASKAAKATATQSAKHDNASKEAKPAAKSNTTSTKSDPAMSTKSGAHQTKPTIKPTKPTGKSAKPPAKSMKPDSAASTTSGSALSAADDKRMKPRQKLAAANKPSADVVTRPGPRSDALEAKPRSDTTMRALTKGGDETARSDSGDAVFPPVVRRPRSARRGQPDASSEDFDLPSARDAETTDDSAASIEDIGETFAGDVAALGTGQLTTPKGAGAWKVDDTRTRQILLGHAQPTRTRRRDAMTTEGEFLGREGAREAREALGMQVLKDASGEPWQNPGDYPRGGKFQEGFDALYTHGKATVIGEDKSEHSELGRNMVRDGQLVTQLSNEWVGINIAKLQNYGDGATARALMEAARNGLLRGDLYRTQREGHTVRTFREGREYFKGRNPRLPNENVGRNGVIRYARTKVEAAYLRELARINQRNAATNQDEGYTPGHPMYRQLLQPL